MSASSALLKEQHALSDISYNPEVIIQDLIKIANNIKNKMTNIKDIIVELRPIIMNIYKIFDLTNMAEYPSDASQKIRIKHLNDIIINDINTILKLRALLPDQILSPVKDITMGGKRKT